MVEGASEIDTILAKHPDAQQILVQLGTNDADPIWHDLASGLGLSSTQEGYAGSYKDYMQQIIDAVNGAGKEVCIAKLPIVVGNTETITEYDDPANPPADSRGENVIQYNLVIDELAGVSGNNISIIPNFWEKFNETAVLGMHRYETEYFDFIHPNATGYATMADEWAQQLLAP